MFATGWHHALEVQAAPPHLLVIVTAVLALVAVAVRGIWRLSRNAITIAHEGGHALAAVLSGRRLRSIRLHSDTSGLTVTRGRPTGPGMIVTLLAGYLTPSLVGLVGAWLLAAHRITITLWVTLALLLVILLMIRNVYGMIAVLVTGGIVFAISWYATPPTQAAFAYFGVWFLLIGGVRPVFELAGQHRRHRAGDSDVAQLAGLTRVPAALWFGLFMLVTIGALAFGTTVIGVLPTAIHNFRLG